MKVETRSERFLFSSSSFKLKRNFLFFNFDLVTCKWKTKILTFRLETRSEILIFYEVQLVTRKKNLCKNVRISNSKCCVVCITRLRKSIL